MKLFLEMANFIVPFVIFGIVTYGVLMHVNVYDTFIKGARNGFFTVIKIMPTLIGLMIAVGILRASGFLDPSRPPARYQKRYKSFDTAPVFEEVQNVIRQTIQ